MTLAELIETHAPAAADTGCLADVPARVAANDNHVMGNVVFAPDYGLPQPVRRFDETFSADVVVTNHFGLRPSLSFAHLPPVIALSGAAGSGKSTVSDFLADRFLYTKSKFARPLKEMCRALGMTEAMIEGDLKEVPAEMLGGQTPRHAMQTLGTEWGRKCMGDDFWVDLWQHSVRGLRVIVDDCRFPNEAARVRRLGGRVIRLTGRGGIAGGHASEGQEFLADDVIENDGTIADLQARVAEVIEGWR